MHVIAFRRRRGAVALASALALSVCLFQAIPDTFAAPAHWTERPDPVATPTTTVPDWVAIVKAIRPAVVNIRASTAGDVSGPEDRPGRRGPRGRGPMVAGGSGFIISANGHMLTNNHVVRGAERPEVRLADGREFRARVVGRDAQTDLALLRIEGVADLPVVPLGDSTRLQVGEPVLAIGNPFGLELTVTTGIVSATGRVIGNGPYDDFIQTDASINPGNSGGPLINARGEAVGINTAIFSRTGGSVGIGFAVPISMAKFVVPQLIETGRVERGWLGVTIQPLTEELARSFDVPRADGVLVSAVQEDSPAARAGLRPGDVVVEYDDQKVGRTTDLSRIVAATPVDKEARLVVLRDGKPVTLTAKVGRLQPPGEPLARDSGGEADRPRLGVTVEPVTGDLARRLGMPASGVVIRQVMDASPAAEAGLRPGDVILEIDRKPVTSGEDLRRALDERARGTAALLLVHRDRATMFVTVRV
jgi:serine protease Do